MNGDQSRKEVEGVYWSARERWGELTTDDLRTVLGRIGQIQEANRIAEAEAEKPVTVHL